MLRTVLGACALLVVAAAAAGCGGVPSGAVATVDGDAIERESFDHWMTVLAKSGGEAQAQVPVPPTYEACVKQKQAAAKPDAKPSGAQARQECKNEYEALRDQTIQLLISFRWIAGEAEDRGVSVEDAEVRRSFEQLKQRSFPDAADYEKFLAASGQTEEDILTRVRYDLLSNKLRGEVIGGTDEITDARVAEYYEKNRARFAQPERRDLRVVITKTKARAEQAAAALAAGGSWRSVAAEYSIDDRTRSQDGKLPAVSKGEQPKALDDAIFDAAKGKTVGPVKTPNGYYVFEVTQAQPAAQQTLEQAKPAIEQLLAAEGQQDAIDGWVEEFRRKWREKTECDDAFLTADCSNGPSRASSRAR
jgi:foldase protein PrsA